MLMGPMEDAGADVIEFSAGGRGHNSDANRREYLDLRKSVWESDASTAEKLVALAIIEHMQPGKLNAYPSQARLLKMCSVSPRTFRRAFAMVRAWFDVEVRPGRATVYSVKIVKTSEEIASLLDNLRGCQKDTQGEGAKKTPTTVPKRHPTPGQNGTLPPANLAPQKRQGRDKEETNEEMLCSEPLHDAPAKSKKSKSKKTPPEAYSEDFEAFWKLYPHRKGKGDASRAWERLSLTQKRKAYAAAKEQMPELLGRMNDIRGNFCPMPATWINQGRFDDEVSKEPGRSRPVRNSTYSLNGSYVGKLI